jgi:hypothetical protein
MLSRSFVFTLDISFLIFIANSASVRSLGPSLKDSGKYRDMRL